MFIQCAKQTQVVGVRARADAQHAFEFGVSQFFIAVHGLALDFAFVVNHHAGAGGHAKPCDAAFGVGLCAQMSGNDRLQRRRMNGQKQTIGFGPPKPGGIHQQNDIGRRGSTLGFQARQDAGIIGINPPNGNACGFGEIAVKGFIRRVMPGRIQIQRVLSLSHAQQTQSQSRDAGIDAFHLLPFEHSESIN